MASEVEICNMALAQIHGSSINSLGESSREAQQCSLFYTSSRDQVLTEVNWGFSNKLTALAELTELSVFDWAFVWAYPTDCLTINHLVRNVQSVEAGSGQSAVALRFNDTRFQTPRDLPPVEYDVMNVNGTKVIVTNEDVMRVNYRLRITDPNLIPVNVRIAISWLLASSLALPIAGVKDGRVLRDDAIKLYSAWITKSGNQDSNESHQAPKESEYITVRETS